MHHETAQHRVGLRRLSRHAHGLILVLLAGLALAATPAAAQPACGDVLTQDTTLTADLDCSGPANPDAALVIGADGITLDLGGHTLSGVTGYRIVNWGHDEVTIRNGEIISEGGTILLEGVSGNVVRDTDHRGLLKGILVESSHHNRLVHNRINSVSLAVAGSDNVIAHNLVTSYESSLSVHGDYNRVVDNIVWGGFLGSSLFLGGNHNAVRGNVFLNNSLFVVNLSGVNDTDFTSNTIGSDGSWVAPGAAQIQDSSRNRFVDNTLFGVSQGFALRSGADNVFRRNDVSGVPLDESRPQYVDKVPDGFLVAAGVTGTGLHDNHVRGFEDDGIDVDAAGTRLGGNSATDNGDLGIEAVPGVIDLGGNSASGNGNPLQCTNVLCG